jgi:signal peptidase I
VTNQEPAIAVPAAPAPAASRRRPGVWLLIVFTALALVGGAAGIFGLNKMAGNYRIVTYDSESMSPTLTNPARLIATRTHGPLRRGDLVLVSTAAFSQSTVGAAGLTVRRVIGIGGDHLVCCDAHDNLQVNGKSVTEDYTTTAPTGAAQQAFDVQVPPGDVFLAGDTRNNAVDSRMNLDTPTHGAVPVQDVDSLVVGTGSLFARDDVPLTTAFTKAGLPDAPNSDTGYSRDQTFMLVGFALFALGIIGVITVAVLRHRTRPRLELRVRGPGAEVG